MGDRAVEAARDAFSRSRWRMEQAQDDVSVEATLREKLGQAGEDASPVETLREALILLEARLEDERSRRIAAEAEVAFLAAQLAQQQAAGLTGRLRRLAGR